MQMMHAYDGEKTRVLIYPHFNEDGIDNKRAKCYVQGGSTEAETKIYGGVKTLSCDPSLGPGQTKISVLERLEREGAYKGNRSYEDTEAGRQARVDRVKTWDGSAEAVAAELKSIQDYWKDVCPGIATSPEILATLYNIGPDAYSTEGNTIDSWKDVPAHYNPRPGGHEDFGLKVGDSIDEMEKLLEEKK